jgi:hypothetical protein
MTGLPTIRRRVTIGFCLDSVVTIVHPHKDVPVGRAVDTVKKIKLEIK